MSFEPKFIRSLPPVVVSDRHIKRYHVSNTQMPIAAAIESAAYAMVPRLLPEWDGETPRGSWLILHEGRDGAAYMNAYSWVWGNVVEVRAAVAGQQFVGCPDNDPTNFMLLDRPWVGCIWELPPFGHERSAWVRHMLDTEHPDLDAYLVDTLPDGPTGQAEPARRS
jgi:hypothetical protein